MRICRDAGEKDGRQYISAALGAAHRLCSARRRAPEQGDSLSCLCQRCAPGWVLWPTDFGVAVRGITLLAVTGAMAKRRWLI